MDQELINEILQRLVRIETKLDQIEDVKNDVMQTKLDIVKLQEKDEKQQTELNELKDSHKWLSRAILGAIISMVASIVLTFFK